MKQKLPRHIAIVMDGNGRWAESRGLERMEGHRAGVEAVKPVVEHCLKNEISVLSLFAFSSENWARPQQEVDFLMHLFLQSIQEETKKLHEQGIRIRFIGDRSRLSSDLCGEMQQAETLTTNNQKLMLNFVLNYGGKWDIVQAAKMLASRVANGEVLLDDINESLFAQLLDTAQLPDPDLFIRTSGEQRISNFFLWQLAYTELYFCQVNWPDFSVDEFEKALDFFCMRKRRYGQLENV